MKPFLIIFFLSIFSVNYSISAVYADEIKPFSSDGCSSFPDGLSEHAQLWLSCCIAHDKAYWKGGTYGQRVDADIELTKCVNAVGQPAIAAIMLAGVRVGGTPFLPTKFRWGYGWSYPSGYSQLSKKQLKQIMRLEVQTTN